MSDTHFVSLTASDKGGSRGAGRISAVPRDTCKHLSQDGLHIHTPGSQELHGGTYKIKNKWNPRVIYILKILQNKLLGIDEKCICKYLLN